MSWKWRNWYQNEIDKETKGFDSRDMVKHNERSDQLFFREDDDDGRARVTTDEERVLRGR